MVYNRVLATDLATDYEITTLCFNKKNKTTYRYSRAYPIKIKRRLSQCPVKYDRTLQLKVGCSEAELNKAVAYGGLRKRRLLEKMFLHQKIHSII